MGETALVILTTALPFSELRGGLPLALALGFHPLLALPLTVVVNSLIFFPLFWIVKLFYDRGVSRIILLRRIIERTRRKGSPYVNRYGLLGLTLFVAIPLPMTGTYSGTLLGWLLGIEWRKAFLAIFLGVFLAGWLVLAASLGVFQFLAWVIR